MVKVGVFVFSKEGLVIFLEGLVYVYIGIIIVEDGFGYKGNGFVVFFGYVFDYIFIDY